MIGATTELMVAVTGLRRPTRLQEYRGWESKVVVASLLQHQLYGLQPFHGLTYMQVAAILGAAVLMALWIPAWRATRVDPAVTLRCD